MASIAEIQYYSLYFMLFLISTVLIRPFFRKPTAAAASLSHPPSPPSLPVIGHLHHLFSPLHQSLHKLSTTYGPILYLNLGTSRQLLVSSAPAAAEIFRTQDLAFATRQQFSFAEKLPLAASGFLNAPFGNFWSFMKKLSVTQLLGARSLERSRALRREEVERFLRKLAGKARDGEAVDVGFELMKVTNNVVCRMMMSARCSEEDDEAEKCMALVREAFQYSVRLSVGETLGPLKWLVFWLYGRRAVDVFERIDELLEKILEEHEERRSKRESGYYDEREAKDVMDALLDVYQDDNAEFKISRTQIKAFFMDLFLAGTDTSAKTMQWAIAELINHPNMFKKLREEIVSTVGKSRLVEESDVPNLPYLQAVVKETLRLHPAGPLITRECRQECKIQGFDIPKRTRVLISTYAIMRDPNVWNDPDEFRPERFLFSPGAEEKLDIRREENFSFVPFGGGRRGCVGKLFALNFMNSTIAAMVQCFDWKVHPDHGVGAKVDMQEGTALTLGLACPLMCFPVVHFNPFTSSI